MFRSLAGALTLALLVGVTAVRADDRKDDKAPPALTGAWTKDAGDLKLTIEFKEKGVLTVTVVQDENGVTATCQYTADKAGAVKAKVTDVKVKGDFQNKPPVGLELGFTWKVKGDTATLDDFAATGFEAAKPAMEGDYARKKAKK